MMSLPSDIASVSVPEYPPARHFSRCGGLDVLVQGPSRGGITERWHYRDHAGAAGMFLSAFGETEWAGWAC